MRKEIIILFLGTILSEKNDGTHFPRLTVVLTSFGQDEDGQEISDPACGVCFS